MDRQKLLPPSYIDSHKVSKFCISNFKKSKKNYFILYFYAQNVQLLGIEIQFSFCMAFEIYSP